MGKKDLIVFETSSGFCRWYKRRKKDGGGRDRLSLNMTKTSPRCTDVLSISAQSSREQYEDIVHAN